MKKAIISVIFSLLIVGFITVDASTQGKTKGKVTDPKKGWPSINVSLNGNGGTAMSSGVSNAFSFNPNAGVEVSWGNFGLGIDASTYKTMSDFDFEAYSAPLKGIDFLTITGSGSNWRSTSFTFGPSYSFSLRSVKPISGIGIVVKSNIKQSARITLSLKGGLTMNEAPDFSVRNNVTRTEIATYSPPADFIKNAFTLKPSISFSYWLSQRIALSANVQYAMQTGQTAFKSVHKELTNISIASPISPDQFTKNISTAPTITTSTVGPDKYLSVGAGLIISFGRKGWDGSVKGKIAEKKGINEGGLKKNEIERKGISENGLKKNEAENMMADAEVKAIAETLVNMRKGWDGSVKGNKNENKANTDVKSIAETLVNLARKGWDGTIKGGKVDNVTNEADLKAVTETLVNIRKGWDGSVKGNKAEYVANDADIKTIAETLVNLRKGWDGSIKGNRKGIQENGLKKNEAERKGWDGTIKGSNVSIPINGAAIHVQTTPEGCIVLFPDNGFKINSKKKTMATLSKSEHTNFGEKVNAGLHAAGDALAQGASLLGGALPGGAVISAAISSVSTMAGNAGGGAAAASYAKTADKKKKKVWDSRKDDDCDGLRNVPDGDYEFEVVIEEKASSKSKKLEQAKVIIAFSSISNVLKTKHDTAKNSINNVR